MLNSYSPDKIRNLISRLNLVSSLIHDKTLGLVTVMEFQYRVIYWNLFVQLLVRVKLILRFFIDTIDIQYKHNGIWDNKQHNLTLCTLFLFFSIIIIKNISAITHVLFFLRQYLIVYILFSWNETIKHFSTCSLNTLLQLSEGLIM